MVNLALLDLCLIIQCYVVPVLNITVYVELVTDIIVIVLVWFFRQVWVSVNVGNNVYIIFMMYNMVRVRRDDWGRWYVWNRFLLDGRSKDELATQSICVVLICY